jgi:glutaredoxin
MTHSIAFRVPPRPEYKAEVVLLITSLGVKRREYNTSKQAMDLLEVIRCHYKLIDFNIDTDGGGGSKPDLEIVSQLYKSHRVRQDKSDGMINLPQVIIDGVNIGDEQSLQALEDDGYLDEILRQTTCPNCLTSRSGEYCYHCKTLFQQVMPGRQNRDALMSRLKYQKIPFVEEDDEDEFLKYPENESSSDFLEAGDGEEDSQDKPEDALLGFTNLRTVSYLNENDTIGMLLPIIIPEDDGEDIAKAIDKLVISQDSRSIDRLDEFTARDGSSEPEVFQSARDKPSEYEFESEPTIEKLVVSDKT